MSAALRKHLESLDDAERDAIAIPRWGERERLAERFGVTPHDVADAVFQTRPKMPADRFKWHAAIIRDRRLGARDLRVAGALLIYVNASGYCWPSQRSLGLATGLDERAARRSLAHLASLGMIRRVRAVDLPRDLANLALGAVKHGGSGRSYRGGAYALTPPATWTAKAVTGSNPPCAQRADSALHNHQDEPEPSSTDSFHINNSPSTVLPSGTVPFSENGEVKSGCSEPHAREAPHDAA